MKWGDVMTQYFIQDSSLSAIADAIRLKTGGVDKLTPNEMAGAINDIDSIETDDKSSEIVSGTISEYSNNSIKLIGNYAFANCTSLTTITLGASTYCTLQSSRAFYSTGITKTTGSIYVPSSLVALYKTGRGWSYFSNIIYGM